MEVMSKAKTLKMYGKTHWEPIHCMFLAEHGDIHAEGFRERVFEVFQHFAGVHVSGTNHLWEDHPDGGDTILVFWK